MVQQTKFEEECNFEFYDDCEDFLGETPLNSTLSNLKCVYEAETEF